MAIIVVVCVVMLFPFCTTRGTNGGKSSAKPYFKCSLFNYGWQCSLVVMMLYCMVILLVSSGAGAVGVEWWQDAVYYRIQVDSFKDTDADGLGDINGVTKQLSYVRALGADGIIVSNVAARSGDCTRPGVVHHTDVDQRYGTLADMLAMLQKANKLDIKVVMELDIQTVSTTSEWFVESAKRSSGFEEFVVRREDEPTESTAGVQWIADDGGTSHYAVRDNEAIVNLCSEGVKAALSIMQCAWLRRGIAGVLLKPDFAFDATCATTLVQHLTAAAVECARAAALDTPVVLIESSMSAENASQYYVRGAKSVLSNALSERVRRTAPEMALRLYADILLTPAPFKATSMTSQLSAGRICSRFGANMVDAINLLALIVPGACVIQQGDEVGAADALQEMIQTSQQCWPDKALPAAAPFPWDDTANGGFTAGDPWLPITPNYRYANAKSQFSSDASHAGIVRAAAAMRKSPAFGSHAQIMRMEDAILVLRWGDTGSLLLVANVGERTTEALPARMAGVAAEMAVAASSAGSHYAVGGHVQTQRNMRLNPGEAVLMAGPPRHCGGPGPVDKIATKLADGWHKINKYFENI